MTYFKDCKTLDDVKKMYRKLVFEHHPDLGGSTGIMQAINIEHEFVTAMLAKGANLSSEQVEQELRFSEEYRNVIDLIINLPFIRIELVGLWIWVTGNTKPVHKELHAAGLTFARKKKAWFYRSDCLKAFHGGKKSLDDIRAKYGSEEITTTNTRSFRRRYLRS